MSHPFPSNEDAVVDLINFVAQNFVWPDDDGILDEADITAHMVKNAAEYIRLLTPFIA